MPNPNLKPGPGRPPGSRNKNNGYSMNVIHEAFSVSGLTFKTRTLPDSWKIPPGFLDIPRTVFYMGYKAIRNGQAIDKTFPSLKNIDHTTDGEQIGMKPVIVQVATKQEADNIKKAIDKTLNESL